MFIIEEKDYFWLLLVIPAILLLFALLLFWRRRAQKKFGDSALLKKLTPNRSRLKPVLKVVILSLALICFIIALANPKFGTKLETVKRKGVDVVFAVDVSRSMLAEDIAPNRLEKAKQLVTQIINSLQGDRVGIIAYAGSAFPQLPITTDYGAAKMFLQALNTNMVSSQGTAIGEAIELATTYFNEEDQTNRLLFIISDGEDHQGQIAEIAKQAAREGIQIYTIGVGTSQGGPIPIKRNGIVQNYLQNEGETVITRLNEETLKKIASVANGEYINGRSTQEVVEKVTEILENMNKEEFESKQIADFKDQFQWFLGFGLFFVFLDVFLLERQTSWLKKLNLFNEKR